jgi:hypothetical protein
MTRKTSDHFYSQNAKCVSQSGASPMLWHILLLVGIRMFPALFQWHILETPSQHWIMTYSSHNLGDRLKSYRIAWLQAGR